MELVLTITTDTSTHKVTTTPWVVMMWERKYRTKASRISTEGLGLEDLAYLSWEALKNAGVEVPISFDSFAQSLRNVTVEGSEERPTHAAPSAT